MIEFSNMQQSNIHVALANALGVTSEPLETSKERALAGYAFAASRSPEPLAEAILLACALRGHAGKGDFCFVLKELTVAANSLDLAETAAGLLGAVHIGKGIWSTCPNENVKRVDIPAGLFRTYLEEWACCLPVGAE